MKTSLLLIALSILWSTNSNSQCHYVQATTSSMDTVIFTYSGGSFSSFGCAPIDPTYWLSGSGKTITATFVTPQDYPTFRVWGMNNDDSATVAVNGILYNLNYNTATYEAKVVCGQSPFSTGIAFKNNKFYGVNTPSEGNYSYQDVQLFVTGVNSITVEGTHGAGWGFAGVSVNCPLLSGTPTLESQGFHIYPNPLNGTSNIYFNASVLNASINIYNMRGEVFLSENNFTGDNLNLNNRHLLAGVYYVQILEKGKAIKIEKLIITNHSN